MHKKKEADFQSKFNQYLRAKKMHGAFELKVAHGNSLSFASVKPHQIAGLIGYKNAGIVWKFSDEDQRQKPFDCISVPSGDAYIVIKYDTIAYCIGVEDFIIEMRTSSWKSLTKQRAEELSTQTIIFG